MLTQVENYRAATPPSGKLFDDLIDDVSLDMSQRLNQARYTVRLGCRGR